MPGRPAQKRHSATYDTILFDKQFDGFDPRRYESVQHLMMGLVSTLCKRAVDDEHDATGTPVKNARYHKQRSSLHLRAHGSTSNPSPVSYTHLTLPTNREV